MRFLRTLRFRLTLWNALAALLTAAAASLGMQVGVRQALQHELDQFLIDDLQTIEDALTSAPAGDADSPLSELKSWYRHPRHGRFVAVFDAQGLKLWETTDHPPPDLEIGEPRERDPFFAGDYRMIQSRVTASDGARLVVRTGIPLAALREEVSRVDLLAVMVTAGAVPIALAVGWFLAGRVTDVLRTLTDRAASMRPVRRGDRLPLRGTDDELDHLATEFNRLFDRLADELAKREDVLANAAHELRTPLASIRSAAEVALVSRREPEEYEATLGDVVDECDSLQELVDQLLTLSDSEADRVRIYGERVQLDELVERTADAYKSAAESGGVEFRCTTAPVNVEGSYVRLRQALVNLLDNALKHVEPGGKIEVDLRRQPDAVELVVRDDGPGIAEEDQTRIFDRFFRGREDRRSGKKGFGLGLPIVRAIVESHGGRIDVESRPGEGAAFRILLPLVAAQRLALPDDPDESP